MKTLILNALILVTFPAIFVEQAYGMRLDRSDFTTTACQDRATGIFSGGLKRVRDLETLKAYIKMLGDHSTELEMLEMIQKRAMEIQTPQLPGSMQQDDKQDDKMDQDDKKEVSFEEMLRRAQNLSKLTADELYQLRKLASELRVTELEKTLAEAQKAYQGAQRKLDIRASESFGGGCHDGCCGFLKLLWNNTTWANCCVLYPVVD